MFQNSNFTNLDLFNGKVNCRHKVKLKILQINLGKRHAAVSLLQKSVQELGVDLVCFQEPTILRGKVVGIPHRWGLFSSKSLKAGIICLNTKLKASLLSTTQDAVSVILGEGDNSIKLTSAYGTTANNIEVIQQEIEHAVQLEQDKEHIICGDFNAPNTLWGYKKDAIRGKEMLEFINAKNLFILNDTTQLPTFEFNDKQGCPDLTLTNSTDVLGAAKWEVLDVETLSDHRYILIDTNKEITFTQVPRFKTKYGSHGKFVKNCKGIVYGGIKKIERAINERDLDQILDNTMLEMTRECKRIYGIKKWKKPEDPKW